MEAERRLQSEPGWSVAKEQAEAPGAPVWASQPTGRAAPSAREGRSRGRQPAPEEAAGMPAGVSFGETEISVSVEE